MIERTVKNNLISALKPGKVTALFGARRTGKTFLLQVIKDHFQNEKSEEPDHDGTDGSRGDAGR